MARILVTGGAGFIGSALVKRLVADGYQVNVLDNLMRGNPRRLDGVEYEFYPGDIRDRGCVALAARNCDVIFHLAYVADTQTFHDNPKMVWDIGVNGIANILDACEKQGDKELFVISSSEAYQIQPEGMTPTDETVPLSVPDVTNPRASYGGGKILTELGAMAYSMSGLLKRAVVIRPHNVTGPDMGTGHVIPQFAVRMKQLVSEHPVGTIDFPIQGTGQETRSFIYVDDLIEAFIILLDKGVDRNVYHVGTMEERTITHVAHAVAACYGREIEVLPGRLAQGSPPRRLPDIRKMRALGFEPQVPFAEAVPKTVEWYANN